MRAPSPREASGERGSFPQLRRSLGRPSPLPSPHSFVVGRGESFVCNGGGILMRPLHGAAEGRRTEFFRLLVFRPISPKRIGEHLTVRSPQPKPRRGVLFIGARKRLLILLFVFRQRDQGLIQIGMFAPCSRRGKTKRKG